MAVSPDPAQRSLAGKKGAHRSWAVTPDRSARTAPARAAMQKKFEQQVDPEGLLPLPERARRAEHLRKAHYADLALRSAKARRARAQLADATAAEAELQQLDGPGAA